MDTNHYLIIVLFIIYLLFIPISIFIIIYFLRKQKKILSSNSISPSSVSLVVLPPI